MWKEEGGKRKQGRGGRRRESGGGGKGGEELGKRECEMECGGEVVEFLRELGVTLPILLCLLVT